MGSLALELRTLQFALRGPVTGQVAGQRHTGHHGLRPWIVDKFGLGLVWGLGQPDQLMHGEILLVLELSGLDWHWP